MNSVLTAEAFRFEQDELVPASGPWDFTPAVEQRREWSFARSLFQHAGLAAMLAVSPMTFGADPWFADRRRQAALTLGATFDAIAGRPISILEARQIALQILARAEQERSRFAEAEARRGIDWELDQ
jgi:hypothetical protein